VKLEIDVLAADQLDVEEAHEALSWCVLLISSRYILQVASLRLTEELLLGNFNEVRCF